MHCHVLGTILTPVIAGLLVADIVRRRRRGDGRGAAQVGRAALGWIGLGLLSYVPLAIHELGNDASELRAAIAFLVDGGGSATMSLPARLPIVGLRVLGWPLAGLITSAPVATILAVGLVVGLAIWRGWLWRGSAGAEARRRAASPRTAGARARIPSGPPCAGSRSASCGPSLLLPPAPRAWRPWWSACRTITTTPSPTRWSSSSSRSGWLLRSRLRPDRPWPWTPDRSPPSSSSSSAGT